MSVVVFFFNLKLKKMWSEIKKIVQILEVRLIFITTSPLNVTRINALMGCFSNNVLIGLSSCFIKILALYACIVRVESRNFISHGL